MCVNFSRAICASACDVYRCCCQAVEWFQIAGFLLTSSVWLWHLLHTVTDCHFQKMKNILIVDWQNATCSLRSSSATTKVGTVSIAMKGLGVYPGNCSLK